MKQIAVVILNWNGAAMLRRFLPSVLAGSGSEAQVYVADNGSTDDSLHVVSSEFPAVRLVRLPRNYGFAEGYNRALSALEEPYFVLLNSDVEVTAGWLDPLLAYMQAHAEVAACQPKVRAQRSPELFEYAGAAGGYIDALGYPFCRGRVMATVEADRGQYDAVAPVFWATGAALMVRRADWQRVGGLDGRFFAHMEEIDLCWRLRSLGRAIVCVPQSTVFHVGAATLKRDNPRKTFLNFRNNLLMLYKNLPARRLRRTLFLRGVLDYAAALHFLLTGDGANAMAVLRARRAFRRMRPEFREDRARLQAEARLWPIPEMMRGSVLAQYYLKRRRSFSSLRWR